MILNLNTNAKHEQSATISYAHNKVNLKIYSGLGNNAVFTNAPNRVL